MNGMKVLFVHHSIGRYCLEAGLREKFAKSFPGLELWDIDYNRFGLRDGAGQPAVIDGLQVPGDNTDPDGLERFVEMFLAADRGNAPGFGFDALVFKSCYTGARIRTDQRLDAFITAGRNAMRQLAEAKFPAIVLTPVPDCPGWSSNSMAARAVAYAVAAESAVAGDLQRVVNLHRSLANDGGFLRVEFRRFWGVDPHPNRRGLHSLGDVIVESFQGLPASK